jgi:DNA polymerase III delta prime subunit
MRNDPDESTEGSLLFAGPTSVGKTVEGAVRCERVLGRWHCHDGRVSTIVLFSVRQRMRAAKLMLFGQTEGSLLFAGPTSVGKTVEGAVRCERVQLPSELGQSGSECEPRS